MNGSELPPNVERIPTMPTGVKAVVDLAFALVKRIAVAIEVQPVHLRAEWFISSRAPKDGVFPLAVAMHSKDDAALYLGRCKVRKVILRPDVVAQAGEVWSVVVTVVSPADGFVVRGELGAVRRLAVSDVTDGLALTVGRGEFGFTVPPGA